MSTTTATTRSFHPAIKALRLLTALCVVLAIGAVIIGQQEVRAFEADLASTWIGLVAPDGAMVWGDSFLVHMSQTQIIAFRITAECTIAILAAPILAFSAVMIGFTRVPVARWILATIAGLGLIVLVNQFRLGLIAWATLNFGLDVGYEVSHTFVGSIIALLGFASSILLMLVVMGKRRRRNRARPTRGGRARGRRAVR